MTIIFVDNFRGFRNTFIPLKDVNFLVGENSTGKTSILSLIKLISSPEFWFKNNDFNSSDINFGHFKDIVSVSSSDKKYFSIGIISMANAEKEEKRQVAGFLVTFTNHRGMPRPSMYIYLAGNDEYAIRLSPKKIKFKRRSIQEYTNVDKFIKDIFCNWTIAYKTDSKGYKELPKEVRGLSPEVPLIFLAGALERVLEGKASHSSIGLRAPFIPEGITWLAPIRSKPRRTYDEYKLDFSSEGAHTPYLIKSIFEKKAQAGKFKKFLEQAGSDSGLFDSIKTKNYGRGAAAPFELDVILKGKELSISNVGYGVSQALPVIVEVFTRPEDSWFAIQQPEVHLHPKAQAALGDIFFELATSQGKKFIVETHSDYTIDRYRLNYRKPCSNEKPKAQILYFERVHDGNKMYQIEIQNDGELPSEQPQGYRNFFIKEEMDLLGL